MKRSDLLGYTYTFILEMPNNTKKSIRHCDNIVYERTLFTIEIDHQKKQ